MLPNPWFILGSVALVLASFFAGDWHGHSDANRTHQIEVAKLNEKARVQEEQRQEIVNAKDTQYQLEQKNAKAQIATLTDDLASHRVRLFIATRGIQASGDAGAASTDRTEARAELDPEAAQRIVSITSEGDDAIRQLNACIDLYNEVRNAR